MSTLAGPGISRVAPNTELLIWRRKQAGFLERAFSIHSRRLCRLAQCATLPLPNAPIMAPTGTMSSRRGRHVRDAILQIAPWLQGASDTDAGDVLLWTGRGRASLWEQLRPFLVRPVTRVSAVSHTSTPILVS